MLRIDSGALDFAMGEGTHVLSIDSGYVRHIQYYSGAAAHVVVIEHDSGIASYYIHMKARNPALTVGMRIPEASIWVTKGMAMASSHSIFILRSVRVARTTGGGPTVAVQSVGRAFRSTAGKSACINNLEQVRAMLIKAVQFKAVRCVNC